MTLSIKNGVLTMEFNENSRRPSKSGKSDIVATTSGFKDINGFKVSINIIKSKE